MKNQSKWRLVAPALAVATMWGVVGCQDKNDNGLPDSAATTGQVERAVDNAGEAVATSAEKAGNTVEGAVDKAAPAVENAVEEGTTTAADAAITGKVKTALLANDKLKATDIDVDTKNKIVHLRGTVPTEAERGLASKIAKETAGAGHPIKNELKVAK